MPITSITDSEGNAQSVDELKPIDEAPDDANPVADEESQAQDDASRDDGAAEGGADDSEAQSGGLTLSLGDEEIADEAQGNTPDWVKKTREHARKVAAENRELRRQLEMAKPETKAPELGPKPTLESCNWETSDYEVKLAEYMERKRVHDEHVAKVKAAQEELQNEWNTDVEKYNKIKADVAKVAADFEEVEEYVGSVLNKNQLGTLVSSPKSTYLLMALGRNKEKLKELAAIKNPIKFAIAIGETGAQLKVNNRGNVPPPEKTGVRGGRIGSGAVVSSAASKSREQALIAQAQKTGDITALTEWRRQQRAAK